MVGSPGVERYRRLVTSAAQYRDNRRPKSGEAAMRSRDINLIRHLPLFADVSPEQMPELIDAAALQRFAPDTRLFHQGDHPDFLHILIEGTVELSAVSADGRESVIEIVTAVDSFILAAALTDAPYLMGARVIEPARILLLPAALLRAELLRCPRLALAIMASMAVQFRGMVRQLKDIKLRSATQRLAAYLMRLHHRKGRDDATATVVTLPVSKRTLAGRLGMTPENLSRAFASLRDYGVGVQGATVTLANPALLDSYCQCDALIDDIEGALTIPH
jgi:CRP/FNR family transcriptional activator FtrB